MRRLRSAVRALLALGAAGLGAACGAPPAPPAQDTASEQTPSQEPGARTTAGDSADRTQTDAYPAAPSPAATPAPSARDATSAPKPATGAQAPAPSPSDPAPPAPSPPRPALQTEPPAPQQDAIEPTTMTITLLSRGKGVPEPARAAYREIRALLEARQKASVVTDLRSQRIGLEGETRLCAQFRSAQDAQTAYDDVRKRASGVDLLQVALAPCPSPKD